jgi:formylglycine-generating enzyme
MKLNIFVCLVLSLLVISSCKLIKGKKKSASSTTGWAYNDPKNGGFEYRSGYSQKAGPGLKYIQGGTFTMGRVEQDVMFEANNVPRRVTVASFYMDETEVRNIDWREYLYWLQRVYPNDRSVYKAALPDTLVWRDELSYNEPYLENYFRHAAYSEYPVVGVSWVKADKFCKWRTDRTNEGILIDQQKLQPDLAQTGDKVFTSDGYLNGVYDGVEGKKPLKNLTKEAGNRRVNMSDGIVLPRYRLPTEAEWEYAALGLVGGTEEEMVLDRRIYPWKGNQIRNSDKKHRGEMLANNVRGRGDYMGVASALNDGYEITAPVRSFLPNDYGLYCMAGNVNEWVEDVYRPTSSMDVNEFQPLRGNVYTNYRRDADGKMIKNQYGELVRDTVANFTNFKDGDYQSVITEGDEWKRDSLALGSGQMYSSAAGTSTPRISDHSRVYKGGSWKDRTYWLSPGTRRYLDERRSTNDIGFRCAMTHLGDSNAK